MPVICPHGLAPFNCEVCQSVANRRMKPLPTEASLGQIASMESAIPSISEMQMTDFLMKLVAARGEPFMRNVMNECSRRHNHRVSDGRRSAYCECVDDNGEPHNRCPLCGGTGTRKR